MNFDEYQRLAMRTSPDGHDKILNGCMGLIGESGEIVDAVKKWKFQSGENAPLPVDKLIDECGDVLWYCAETADGLHANLSELFRRNQILASNFFEEMKQEEICSAAFVISQICGAISTAAFDKSPYPSKEDRFGFHLTLIITSIQHFLRAFCGSDIAEAMARNIEKLRRRYPDGFDPERSLHRAE